MSEESNTPESEKNQSDWLNNYILIIIAMIGFFFLCGSFGFEKAILFFAIGYLFGITIVSNYYTDKLEKLKSIPKVVLVFYILSLVVIMTLADSWELAFIFPLITLCLWLLEKIWQKIFHSNKK